MPDDDDLPQDDQSAAAPPEPSIEAMIGREIEELMTDARNLSVLRDALPGVLPEAAEDALRTLFRRGFVSLHAR